jgi:hypothetical protein
MEAYCVFYEVRTESVYVDVSENIGKTFLNLVVLVILLIVHIETCGPVKIGEKLLLLCRLKWHYVILKNTFRILSDTRIYVMHIHFTLQRINRKNVLSCRHIMLTSTCTFMRYLNEYRRGFRLRLKDTNQRHKKCVFWGAWGFF